MKQFIFSLLIFKKKKANTFTLLIILIVKSLQIELHKGQLKFLVSSILPKNDLENENFCPSLLGQKFFVRFLEELKKTKSSFEIN